MSSINFFNYHESLQVPKTWDSLKEFSRWYLDNKVPIRIPAESAVYNTGQVTSIVIFRHDVYQVELYLVNPHTKAAEHYHPDIELFMVQIGAMNTMAVLGKAGPLLTADSSHGAAFNTDAGAVFLAIEKWRNGVQMTSASVNWKGQSDGPVHEAMIKKYYPDAYTHQGYVDITRKIV
jgi:hypothetical protein